MTTVLVVGGGATGTGVARDLALRGVDVTLVDRGGVSGGTSGRSHGVLHSGARYAESDPPGAEECIEENRILRSVAGDCVRKTDGLFVGLSGDDPDYFEEKLAACEAVGIEAERLTPAAARERAPGLSADVEGTVRPHAPLEGLTVEDGRVTAATLGGTVDGTVGVDHVVNATGAWAGEVAAMAGVDIEMAPARGVMVAVEYDALADGPVLNRCRTPDDGDIVVPHGDQVVLGTTSVPVDDPEAYERADWEVERSIEECAAMLPPVAEAPVARSWWGVRPLYEPDEAGEDRRDISRGFFLLDHADGGVDNLLSVVGGKLTTYRRMAEAAADRVCDRLDIDADCRTADRKLPGADDAAELDALVAEYDARSPTDEDVVAA
ncbi:glycerol-3-phosphate dehydrogenase [Halobacteriales archaeon QS_8_69_73]|nr:MAG: glycerol-3-phosphate dehydrogenase [Halobacteriales archaeon QS_8_69_73]